LSLEKPDFVRHFREGIAHFNASEFWHAHESWETLWLAARSETKQFLQGLIQVAAAYHHVKRGTLRGAPRLFEAGMAKLAPFPQGYCGLDRSAVKSLSSDFPKLREIAIAPPANDW